MAAEKAAVQSQLFALHFKFCFGPAFRERRWRSYRRGARKHWAAETKLLPRWLSVECGDECRCWCSCSSQPEHVSKCRHGAEKVEIQSACKGYQWWRNGPSDGSYLGSHRRHTECSVKKRRWGKQFTHVYEKESVASSGVDVWSPGTCCSTLYRRQNSAAVRLASYALFMRRQLRRVGWSKPRQRSPLCQHQCYHDWSCRQHQWQCSGWSMLCRTSGDGPADFSMVRQPHHAVMDCQWQPPLEDMFKESSSEHPGSQYQAFCNVETLSRLREWVGFGVSRHTRWRTGDRAVEIRSGLAVGQQQWPRNLVSESTTKCEEEARVILAHAAVTAVGLSFNQVWCKRLSRWPWLLGVTRRLLAWRWNKDQLKERATKTLLRIVQQECF